MIGRNGEGGSGISVLAARHDDDDDCLSNILTYSFLLTSLYFLLLSWFTKNTFGDRDEMK